jgi:YD repeat-containing protein
VFAFDALDRMTRSVDQNAHTWQQHYDAVGHVTHTLSSSFRLSSCALFENSLHGLQSGYSGPQMPGRKTSHRRRCFDCRQEQTSQQRKTPPAFFFRAFVWKKLAIRMSVDAAIGCIGIRRELRNSVLKQQHYEKFKKLVICS